MQKHTLLVVDPYPLFREGLRAALAHAPELVLAGEVSTAEEAAALIGDLTPDVVTVETVKAGAALVRELRRRCPTAAVLVLSARADEQHVVEALGAGARGFASKEQPSDETVRAILLVAQGHAYLDPAVSRCVLDRYLHLSRGGSAGPLPGLTPRERDVFSLTAQGVPTPVIASRLSISRRTVDSHRTRLMRKLDVHSTADLVRLASRLGVLEGAQPITG